MTLPTKLPAGFQDIFGSQAWRETAAVIGLIALHRRWGYDLLKLSTVELKSSFSAEVVGSSPWPEWSPNNCIEIKVHDYDAVFSAVSSNDMVLIPEGTVSVARWLAGILHGKNIVESLPVKVMYHCPCFRNEPITSITSTKFREFSQFGCEIIGTSSLHADVEVLMLAAEGIQKFGLAPEGVVIRIGNVEIFNSLASRTGLDNAQSILIKESLDKIAEDRAKKKVVSGLIDDLLEMLGRYTSNESLLDAWRWIASTCFDMPDNGNVQIPFVPWEISRNAIQKVTYLCENLARMGIRSRIDLAVVRSHEYYTSIAFEIDYENGGALAVEVAGGGRYDRLVDPFLDDKIGPLSSTGYAFGVQRVLSVAAELGVQPNSVEGFKLDSSRSLYPRGAVPSDDFMAAKDRQHTDDTICEIYLGDDMNMLDHYAQKTGANVLK